MTEWLETNNAGAFASSTLTERNDRKYHGLLVTPVPGHEGRYNILSAVDAFLKDGSGLTLGTNRYPDTEYPDSKGFIAATELMPWPAWLYSHGGTSVRKEIFMRSDEPAVWVVYTLTDRSPAEADAELKFLFSFRNSHELTSANNQINTGLRRNPDGITIEPYKGLPGASILFSGDWESSGEMYWDYNVCYETEKERGLDWIEDRFVPGNISIKLKKGIPFIIRIGTAEGAELKSGAAVSTADFAGIYSAEKQARIKLTENAKSPIEILKTQSRHFLLKNPSGKQSINAGYPWFGEWGRDTMIALPGLTFYSDRTETGVQILCDYISMIKDGLLPNTLGETQGFTSYNSIDAGLLFCWAAGKLLQTGYGESRNENEILTEIIRPAVESIIDAFLSGRVPSAELTGNGLIWSGSRDTQLTWMDATAWGKPVTPRYGFAVELNSLWYDALVLSGKLNHITGRETDGRITELIKKIPDVFRSTFWLPDAGYLSDTVNENGPDRKLRPNMLFASSASEGLLTKEQRAAVSDTAERSLLTPMGMRIAGSG